MNKVTNIKEVEKETFGIQDLLRAQDVKRWNIVSMARQQTLAEHTFNVVMIARHLAKKMNIDDANIIKYALDHDLDEILSCDWPTTAKERYNLPRVYNGKSKLKCNDLELNIVTLADKIEAVWYCWAYGLGRHAQQVSSDLIDDFNVATTLYCTSNPDLERAVGEVVDEINHGDFVL